MAAFSHVLYVEEVGSAPSNFGIVRGVSAIVRLVGRAVYGVKMVEWRLGSSKFAATTKGSKTKRVQRVETNGALYSACMLFIGMNKVADKSTAQDLRGAL